MKKIVALVLTTVLLCTLFAGCNGGPAGTELSGTELAKLLLANQRLDAGALTNGFEISGMTTQLSAPEDTARRIKLLSASISGGTATWKDFTVYCDIKSFFDSYTQGIENDAQQYAELIDIVKNDIGVTGQWLTYDNGSAIMLVVEANQEVIYERMDWGYRVCRRYTNSSAQSVYEMYILEMESDISIDVQGRMLYIPGARYEFTLDYRKADNTGNLYIVAEKDRGYWNMFYAGYEGDSANICSFVQTGDLAFSVISNVRSEGLISGPIAFSAPDLSYDIVMVQENMFEMYAGGFNGISAIKAPDSACTGNYLQDANAGWVVTDSGAQIRSGDVFAGETVTCSGIWASYDDYGDSQITRGNVSLTVAGDTIAERFANFSAFLSEVGITCKYSLNTLQSKVTAANTLVEEFENYYRFNGYAVDSLESLRKGIAAEDAAMAAFDAMYEAVKDYPEGEMSPFRGSVENYDFPAVESLSGTATMEGGVVTVKDLSAILSDLTLIEDSEQYTLALALVYLNGDAYGDAVILDCSGTPDSSFTLGSDLKVTQSAAYLLPECSRAGTCTVVAYVATADGIRVSQMVPLVFSGDLDQSMNSTNFSVQWSKNSAGEATGICTANLDLYLQANVGTDSYTHAQINELMVSLVLEYGFTVDGAVLEVGTGGSYAPADEAASLGAGSMLRLQYARQTETGEELGYIYLTLTA